MADKGKIRYAVVGAGSIAQDSVLPAFQNAQNSELVALVSGDDEKREELGKQYHVRSYPYEQFEQCIEECEADAVYIALPNHMHREYAERAAAAGAHILCEKPLAPTEEECRRIIDAAREADVRLMTAYRLHFEEGNLEAIRQVESGALGDVRFFDSVFCQNVDPDNVRLKHTVEEGGGPLFDLGVYCINAARYLFRDEPLEVSAFRSNSAEERFQKTDEMLSVMLRFPKDRLATFTVSFGAASMGRYSVAGTQGTLTLDPGYSHAGDIRMQLNIEGLKQERTFEGRDQFAPELLHFSDCILNRREPEPSGEDGLADVQIIRAAYRSCNAGRAMPVDVVRRKDRPDREQEIKRPAVEKPELLNAKMPSGSTNRD